MAAPGQTGLVLNAAALFLRIVIFAFGTRTLRLHALPDHIAHKTIRIVVQIVGVLRLLALFTHTHAFRIAALLLALGELPDFGGPLNAMARALDRMAPPEPADGTLPPDAAGAPEAAPRPRRKGPDRCWNYCSAPR